jgi:hypothetical protein
MTVATLALTARRSNRSATDLIHTRLDLIYIQIDLSSAMRLDLFHTRQDLIHFCKNYTHELFLWKTA